MIKFSNVSFNYNDKNIIRNFSKTFEDGKIYIISGESGKGKTTLLKLAYGLLEPNEGTITRSYKTASYIFDKDNLFNTSVLNNLLCVSSDLNKIDELLSYFDILDLKNNNITKLSNGQKRRVVIIRALLIDADIYFIDEAIRGLDKNNVELVINIFKKKFVDKTVLYVTHSIDELIDFADEIIKL